VKAATDTGFTLVELMITVAVVGILGAVAIPSYQGSIARGNRADARTALLDNAQFLERNFTEANRYDQDSAANAVVLPVTTAPRAGTAMYNVAAATLTATAYTLTATPIVGGRMAGDSCGAFSLNNFGQKTVSGTETVDRCWNR
jgi:type IV pilus assembly protein PilE